MKIASRCQIAALVMAVASGGVAIPAAAQLCTGDLSSNGEDLGILLSAWGACITGPPTCRGDPDEAGLINSDDLGCCVATRVTRRFCPLRPR